MIDVMVIGIWIALFDECFFGVCVDLANKLFWSDFLVLYAYLVNDLQ